MNILLFALFLNLIFFMLFLNQRLPFNYVRKGQFNRDKRRPAL